MRLRAPLGAPPAPPAPRTQRVGAGLGKLGTGLAVAGTAAQLVDQIGALVDVAKGDMSGKDWAKDYYAPSVVPNINVRGIENTAKAVRAAYDNDGIGAAIGAGIKSTAENFLNPVHEAGKSVGRFAQDIGGGIYRGITGKRAPQETLVPTEQQDAARRKQIPVAQATAPNWPDATSQQPPGPPGPLVPVSSAEQFARTQAAQGATRLGAPQAAPTEQSIYVRDIPDFTGSDNRRRAETMQGSAEIQYRGKPPQRGGFVGAATDAEAAQAMQDRAAQSAAAQQNIAQMNAGAEAERDTRAARLGVSRDVLDKMEGRTPNVDNTPAMVIGTGPDKLDVASGRVINRDTPYSVVANKMADAHDRKTRESIAQAFMADKELQGKETEADATQASAVAKAAGDQRAALLNQQGQDRREAARLGVDRERIAAESDRALLGIKKDLLLDQNRDTRQGAEESAKQYAAGAAHIAKVTSADGKNPPQLQPDQWKNFLDQMDVNQTAKYAGVPVETAQRWKSGTLKPNEAQWLTGAAVGWAKGQPGWWGSLFKQAPTAQQYITPGISQ